MCYVSSDPSEMLTAVILACSENAWNRELVKEKKSAYLKSVILLFDVAEVFVGDHPRSFLQWLVFSLSSLHNLFQEGYGLFQLSLAFTTFSNLLK